MARIFRVLMVLILCGAGACGCGALSEHEAGVTVWRFAIEEPAGSVQDAYAQEFKRRIEAGSDGRVRVVVYPYGTLGTSDQTTELVSMGAVELATASPGHLGKLIPEVQALLLHFVFTDDENVNSAALNDPGLLGLLGGFYEEKGFRLLTIFSEGWMAWTSKRPLERAEDFQGLKIRVMTSPMLLAAYSAYGAAPTPLPYGEVYSALQLNMIDAQVNPLFAIEEMSFYEVTDYLVFGYQSPFVTTLTCAKGFYESLAAEDRALLDETVTSLGPYIVELERRYNTERLEIMRARKPSLSVSSLSAAEREKLRSASMTAREVFLRLAPAHGEAVLQALLAAVERAGAAGNGAE